MNENEIEMMFHACNVCQALVRNISNNFLSVSFALTRSKLIDLKISLESATLTDYNLIEDFVAELSALYEYDCVGNVLIVEGSEHLPLSNLVYLRSSD